MILHHSDCLSVLPLLLDQSVDLILFDPPFKMFQDYKQVRKENKTNLKQIETKSNEEYNEWWDHLCQESARVLKPSGYFIFKSDPYMAREIYFITIQYFKFYKSVVWDKGKIGLGRKIRMQHELIEVYGLDDAHEIIEVYATQDKCAHYWKYKTSLKSKKPKYKNLLGNIVENQTKEKKWHGSGKGIAFPSVLKVPVIGNGLLGAKTQSHINQTPRELWDKFIDYMCPKDGTVLDLCMGSGSVGLSVQYYNRKNASREYIGVELEREFYEFAVNQLQPPQTLLDR